MYGFQVPRDYEQAVSIDEDNKNTKWQDSLRKNSVRLMNMRPSMTNKVERGTQLCPQRFCIIQTRLMRHPYRYIPIGTQRLRNVEY
jgi:hypothetical protein